MERMQQWRQYEADQRKFQSTSMPNFKVLHEKNKIMFDKQKQAARSNYKNTEVEPLKLTTESRANDRSKFEDYLKQREMKRDKERVEKMNEQQRMEDEAQKEYRKQLDRHAKSLVHPNPFK